MQTAITVAPAATAALIPDGESSKMTARVGSIPRSAAASKKGSGKGLPRRSLGSSAVTQTLGIVILNAPWSRLLQKSVKKKGIYPVRSRHPWQYVLAPEVAMAYLS